MTPSVEQAEIFALEALGWLLGNEELLPVFMGSTGVGADELRGNAGDPAFLASVLDFLMLDDAWVVGFCDSVGAPYDRPMAARMALPGGAQVNWT